MADGQAYGNQIRPTRNVVALMTLIEKVEARQAFLPGMAVFYGPSGFGKTFAAIHANLSKNAVHIQCRDFWTPKSLAEAILGELRAPSNRRQTLSHMFEDIVAALIRDPRPLIIDEADHLLNKKMLEFVRGIHDDTQNTVVLIGEEELPQHLTRIERVHNRIAGWVAAEPADLEDARQLARYYANQVEISEDLLAAIVKASGGRIRRVSNNLSWIAEDARTRGVTRMTLEDWGSRDFYTGEPPLGRRDYA